MNRNRVLRNRNRNRDASVAAFGVLVVVTSTMMIAATACSSVLGFEPLTHLPDDATASEAANNTDGPVSSTDSGTSTDGGDATSCVADLTTDPKHCGRCNHDCVGGMCQAGKCQAIKLADGLAIPEGLVVDTADVFVAEYDLNRIVRFGKNALGPCTSSPLPAQCVFTEDPASVHRPTAMGIDATNVFWANTGGGTDHSIKSCPRGGCGAQAAKLVAQLGQEAFAHLFGNDVLPLDLIVKDGQVFWPESLGGAIRSTDVGGGGPITTYLESGSFMPLAIAVDDTHVYFTDDTNQHPTRIQAVPRDGTAKAGGSAVKVIASTPAKPYGIGLTASGNLYWTVPFVGQAGDGVVQAASKTADGGDPIGAVATNEVEPRALIVDATNVYWLITGSTSAATGIVVYCPLASGCPTDGPIILAKDQRVPLHITQDESAIYWSNEGLPGSVAYDGQVWKIAKP